MTVAHTDGTQQGAPEELVEASVVSDGATPETAADPAAVDPAGSAESTGGPEAAEAEATASTEAVADDGTEADPVEEEWRRDERFEAELAEVEDMVPDRSDAAGTAPDEPVAAATAETVPVEAVPVEAVPVEAAVPAESATAEAADPTPVDEVLGETPAPDSVAVEESLAPVDRSDAPAGADATTAEGGAAPAEAADAAEVAPSPAAASPVESTPGRPTPGRPTPGRPNPGGPGRRPVRPAGPPAVAVDAGSALREAMAFGRVADDGTVFVRTAAGEREVGTWAPGETDQALAFFARRFATLETEVELAESRARAGALSADATTATAARLAESLATAQVVGDLDDLARRIGELPELALERREQRRTEKATNLAQARKAKEELVAEAEVIGLSDTWRAGPERLRELFEIWQGLPRLDKPSDDALWHRFSAARTTFTRRRKAHYNELAEKRVEVRTAKQLLIAEAEKLAESTDWGPTTAAHRDLMARWKTVGSASKDDDDALWNRFHTARQAFFDARAAHDELRSSGEKDALNARRDVLTEAEALVPVTDLKAARRALRVLRERWDAAGHVPRGATGGLDARWKAVETAIQGSEKQEWRRTDPEAVRRAEQAATQLRTSIAKLEAQATAAEGRGDTRAATQARESATARREWLVQAERVLTEAR